MATYYDCCSFQAIIGRNVKLGRVVEEASKESKIELFSSIFEINSHFRGGGGGGGRGGGSKNL